MQFELDVITQCISGSLSLSKIRRSDLSEPRHLLKERFPFCLKHYQVVYTRNQNQWQLHSFVRHCLDELYELPITYPDREYPSVESSPYADLLPKLTAYFQLPMANIAWTTYEKKNQKLTIELIALSEFDKLEPAEIYFHYYQYVMKEEEERIKEQWTQTIFSLPEEKTIRLYIRNHHQALLRLKEQILQSIQESEHKYLHRFAPVFCLEDTFKAMYAVLDELLLHLEHQYGSYLDLEARLSYRKRRQSLQELAPQLNWLQNQLPRLSDIMRSYIQAPLEKLHKLPYDHQFTYQQLAYGRYWLKILIKEFTIIKVVDINVFIRAVVQADFNDVGTLHFLTNYLQQNIREHPDTFKHFRYWMKAIRQIPIQSPMRYDPALPSLKEQVLDWLQEELAYQESIALQDTHQQSLTVIPTNLSVSQWAFLLRVMHEVGIFKPQQQMDLFRAFGKILSTKRVSRISIDSLQSKYYNVEESTRSAIQEKIYQMLEAVRQPR